MAATTGMNSVDGGGDQRLEAAGDEMIQRPRRQSELCAGEGVWRSFPNFCPCVYIARPCRCDRVEQLGGTETARVSLSSKIGYTNSQFSVRPRITCAMDFAESVEPSFSTRWVRDGFGGNLTLNFQIASILRIVLTG